MSNFNNEFDKVMDWLEDEHQQARAFENWDRMKEIERIWQLLDEEEMENWNENRFEEWIESVRSL